MPLQGAGSRTVNARPTLTCMVSDSGRNYPNCNLWVSQVENCLGSVIYAYADHVRDNLSDFFVTLRTAGVARARLSNRSRISLTADGTVVQDVYCSAVRSTDQRWADSRRPMGRTKLANHWEEILYARTRCW
jgi:hypothetical protein